jgi:hypothetical protein
MEINQPFTLPAVSGKTFKNEAVTIDGKRFENYKFIDCHIIYSGGPADASACEFSPNLTWEFRGNVGMIVQVLPHFGWRLEFGGEPPVPIKKV